MRYGPTCRPRGAFRGRVKNGFQIECCRPCGTGASNTPTCKSPASSATQPNLGSRNINPMSIGYALGPRLRSRLTLGGLTFPRKPCAFGGRASHPSYRYSFRHTHSPPLHRSFPSGFSAGATLSYHLTIRDCGATLESPSFSARDGSTGKLLRTFEMVAASKPTSRLSRRSHFL